MVYEHPGGKQGLYAVVVEREVQALLTSFTAALVGDHPRELLEQATLALLRYVEEQADGFLDREFASCGHETTLSALYSQALVGQVALVGQWWLDHRPPTGTRPPRTW